jgi:hypothetical protein
MAVSVVWLLAACCYAVPYVAMRLLDVVYMGWANFIYTASMQNRPFVRLQTTNWSTEESTPRELEHAPVYVRTAPGIPSLCRNSGILLAIVVFGTCVYYKPGLGTRSDRVPGVGRNDQDHSLRESKKRKEKQQTTTEERGSVCHAENRKHQFCWAS